MSDNNAIVTMKTSGYSFYPLLAPFPVAFFLGAFVTDLAYWHAPDAMWETFSIWLITAGLLMAGLSVVAGFIDLISQRRNTAVKPVWLHNLAIVVAFVLAFINALVHSRDGYTAVVPTGLILSGVVVGILLCAAWTAPPVVYRHRAGEVN
jgi:uncharacterized membrane protein